MGDKMAKKSTIPPLPGKDEKDISYTAGMMLLKAVPWVGGAASEYLAARIARPVDRRRAEWLNTIRDALIELQEQGKIDVESLSDNDAFTTVVIATTMSALKTHQGEKLTALKNCVLNAAVGINIDDSVRQIFIELVDRFTPIHLKLLVLFADPLANIAVAKYFQNISMGGLLHVIGTAYSELKGQDALVRVIWQDLTTNGLIGNVELGLTMTGSGCTQKRTTPLGDAFLEFVWTAP